MNIIEAVKLLDEVEKGDYGERTIFSKSLNKYLINSRHGICQCGNDWTSAYRAYKKDFEATDWELSD